MSEDHLSKIDSILADELSGLDLDSNVPVGEKKREDMIQILQFAADELGKSPTVEEFNSLGLQVSADEVRYIFGTWNEAKEAAGLETWQRGKVRNINETYFEVIDSLEKSYWLGALLATSSVRRQPNESDYVLVLGRVEDKAYFVTEFADVVGSDYSLQWHKQNKSNKQQIQLQISNQLFIEHLFNKGYPRPGDEKSGFPAVDAEYRTAFLRGLLESSGYFTTNGWNIVVANHQRSETLQNWFEQYGAKRPTVSQEASGKIVVRVTNAFDISAIFESLWPDILETDPSWRPYPEKILRYLESNHPYPENLSYLDNS